MGNIKYSHTLYKTYLQTTEVQELKEAPTKELDFVITRKDHLKGAITRNRDFQHVRQPSVTLESVTITI